MCDYDHLIIIVTIAILHIRLLDDTLNDSLFLDDTFNDSLFLGILTTVLLFSSSSADLMLGGKKILGGKDLLVDFF